MTKMSGELGMFEPAERSFGVGCPEVLEEGGRNGEREAGVE